VKVGACLGGPACAVGRSARCQQWSAASYAVDGALAWLTNLLTARDRAAVGLLVVDDACIVRQQPGLGPVVA
jgi:hypothetical protein